MASETRRTHHQVTFAVLAAGVATYTLLQSLVTPVLGTIAVDLHTDQATITWVLTAYLLSASIFTPIMGRIGDAFGKEKVFVLALVALSLGSLLAALATNVQVMIIARVIQGIGGGVLPLAFGIVHDEFRQHKVSGAVGTIASISAVGGGLGIVLAGPIVNALDYHWPFWFPMILTITAAIAAHLLIPESPLRTPGRISWLPAALLSAWLVALLLALSQAPSWGWGSGKVIGLILAAIVLATIWIQVELRSASPLIDMRMMRLTAVWTNNLVALLIGVAMYSVFACVPQFVQTPSIAGYGFGASITASGLILLPSSIAMFLAGIGAGNLARRIGAKSLVVLGCSIGTVAMIMLAFGHGAQWQLYASMAVMGIGLGLVFASIASLIVSAVPATQTGVASAMNADIRTIGGSIGAALMASIVTSDLGSGGLPKESGYTHGFIMLAGALLVASLAALLIPAARKKMIGDQSGSTGIGFDDEPSHSELALVPGRPFIADKPE